MKKSFHGLRKHLIVNAFIISSLLLFVILFSAFRADTSVRAREEIAPPTVRFSENFDGVSAPALPFAWSTSRTGGNSLFTTATTNSQTLPNSLFTNNPSTAGSSEVTSPSITLGNARSTLTFRHSYATESRRGYDGGVLEVSVNDGGFQDVLSAGATFAGGAYIEPIRTNANGNPLIGRMAWTGDSRGFTTTVIHFPLSFANQSIRLRWRFATSDTFEGVGWWIDSVKVEDYVPVMVSFSENFDNLTAPELPPNWTIEQTDEGRKFRSSTEASFTAPNSIYAPAPFTSGSAAIISPSIRVGGNSPKLIFQNYYACDQGLDGGVLEISINGGAFQDILEAGGSFVHGGYSGTISDGGANPLENRQAWTGATNSFILTEVSLPPAAYRQNVRFKWIFGTNNFLLTIGWWIDSIQVIDTLAGENLTSVSIPGGGVAAPYPTEIQVDNLAGSITNVRVNLVNFSHVSPDDVDLMLVAPSGRKIVLMSDVGGTNPVTNLSLTFDDAANNSFPDNAPVVSGSYRPTNFEIGDIFPAPAPAGPTTGNLLGALNGSEPNGTWKLFLVDDNGTNAGGSIAGGWSLSIQTATEMITIPGSGTAQPYPSEFAVTGLPGAVSKVSLNLSNFSHTAPDDVDLMLVAPNGRRVVVMSDVGGNTEAGNLNITLDDDAAANLPDNAPLSSGTFKPTNFEPGDAFPAPAPQGQPTGTTLGNFFGTNPNGIWKLYVVDDTGENFGSVAGNWSLDLQSSLGTCQFDLSSNAQAFPVTGGGGAFNVQIPAGCPWTASASYDFINIASGSGGEGSGTINFNVAANPGPGRTGTIVISNGSFSRSFMIQQQSGCPFAVNQSSFNFPSAGGSANAQISAGTECGWQAVANVNWISVTSLPQTGNGILTFNVQANTGGASRSGVITVGAQTITVSQAGAAGKRFDFDGDGRADISVYRQGNWYLQQSAAGFAAIRFGLANDKLAPADYDGDGKTDIAVFRDGNWYILQSSNSAFRPVQFGLANDKPVPADYNGDGKAELAVFRTGNWFIFDLNSNQTSGAQFGIASDQPVPADYDGDGKTDFAVYREGIWYLLRSNAGFASVQFGIGSDKPLIGDFDGDGKADQSVYRAGVWYLLQSSQGFSGVQFGISTDVPVAADYDGDGKTDIAVYRDNTWYLFRSQQGFTAMQFGQTNDTPIPSAFLP